MHAVQISCAKIYESDSFRHGAAQPPEALKFESPRLFSREAAKARRLAANRAFFAPSRLRVTK
jgi:hypothetical protein